MKPYKHLCAFSKNGCLYCRWLHNDTIETIRKTDIIANNAFNFSDEDLNSINEALKLFRSGELGDIDCNKCKHRFICWTHNDGLKTELALL